MGAPSAIIILNLNLTQLDTSYAIVTFFWRETRNLYWNQPMNKINRREVRLNYLIANNNSIQLLDRLLSYSVLTICQRAPCYLTKTHINKVIFWFSFFFKSPVLNQLIQTLISWIQQQMDIFFCQKWHLIYHFEAFKHKTLWTQYPKQVKDSRNLPKPIRY